ncbi:putative ubiquitin carboxyl-terminal hydrolase [Planoprotostelium fungivorum]|uniref:Putative ubiquitin carboxyl-terminal hydrolase n=1 Tax=Planoprotostelium fungivorum TaxID=1890364 RepID=A0A2P6NHI3_9EUKA|nr:putative ubiquitin carboxyl-terminal hydrolase [Planoprotostelium fungivorum]
MSLRREQYASDNSAISTEGQAPDDASDIDEDEHRRDMELGATDEENNYDREISVTINDRTQTEHENIVTEQYPANLTWSDLRTQILRKYNKNPTDHCLRFSLDGTNELTTDDRVQLKQLNVNDNLQCFIFNTHTEDRRVPSSHPFLTVCSSSDGDDSENLHNSRPFSGQSWASSSGGSGRWDAVNQGSGGLTRSSSSDESTFYTTSTNYNVPKPLPPGLIGIQNQGATCYLNSLIQSLYMTPEFRRMIYMFERPWDRLLRQLERKGSEASEDIILQMQMLFARMQTSKSEPVSTSGLTRSFGWDSSDNFVQHDVQELNRILCDRLEDKMKGNIKENSPTIAGLYRGMMVNMIKCTTCKRISKREEEFYDISLVVKGKKDVRESLDEFTEEETLEEENAYHCDKCASKQKAIKSTVFKTLPKILNIQLKRFEYDWNSDTRVKLDDDVKFPPYLDMSDYVLTPEDENSMKSPRPEGSEASDLATSPEVPRREENTYELFAILVHSGNAGYGHYYVYIKNFADAKWYKFNDETVTFVSDHDISDSQWLNAPSSGNRPSWMSNYGRSTTPYMLVYRQREGVKMEDTKASTPIPIPLVNYIEREAEEQERVKREKEEEENTIRITVYRSVIEKPAIEIRLDRNAKFGELREKLMKILAEEKGGKPFYRIRRMVGRKNATRRPSKEVYQTSDDAKKLYDLQLDKKNFVYLEESGDPSIESDLSSTPDDMRFLSLRVWNPAEERPSTLADLSLPANMKLSELREYLSQQYLGDVDPNLVMITEEETEKVRHLMSNPDMDLSSYKLITGDILHVEIATQPLSEWKSDVERFYNDKLNEIYATLEESSSSFSKRRPQPLTPEEDEATPVNDWSKRRIEIEDFLIWKDASVLRLKQLIQKAVGETVVPLPHQIREWLVVGGDLFIFTGLFVKEYAYYEEKLVELNEDNVKGRLEGKFRKPELIMELLETAEYFEPGDMNLTSVYYNEKSEPAKNFKLKINKSQTVLELRRAAAAVVGISPENLLVSRHSSSQHHSVEDVYERNSDVLSNLFINTNTLLRFDYVPSQYNSAYTEENLVYFQIVQFISWDGAQMQCTEPAIVVLPLEAKLADVRREIAHRNDVQPNEISMAFVENTNTLPIFKRSASKYYSSTSSSLVNSLALCAYKKRSLSDSGDEQDKSTQEMELEGSPEDQLEAKRKEEAELMLMEEDITLDSIRMRIQYRPLSVICWEDTRKNCKPTKAVAAAKHKRNFEGESLKIKS